MTRKRKNRFRMKLLSIMLAASMLTGSLSTSAFAAADEKAGGVIVTDEVTADVIETEDVTDTKGTADTEGTTEGQSADMALLSGGVTQVLNPTEDDTKQETEEVKPEASDGTGALEETQPKEADKTEKPEEKPAYATVEEFMDAIAAFGDITDEAENEAALDNCDSIYARLSPEDQAAMVEYHEALAAYRANPNEGVESMALTTGHTQSMKFTILYISDEFNLGYNYSGGSTYPFTCQDSVGHSGYNHTILISEIWKAINGAYVQPGWEIVGWAKGLYPDKNVTIYTQKSGTTYASSSNYYFMGVAKRVPSVNYTVNHHYRINGTEVGTDTDTGTDYRGVTIYGSNLKQTRYDNKDYSYNSSQSTYSITLANGNNVLNLYYDRTEQEQQYYARVLYNSNANGDSVNGMPSEYKYVGTDASPSYTLSSNIPTRSGYVFKGWSTTGGENNAANKVSGSVTLSTSTSADGPINRYYAIWEKANPAISVSKTVNGDTERKSGDTVSFTITVKNTGNVDFRMAVISDTLPGGLTYKSATGNPVTTNPYIIWILNSLLAGEEQTFVVDATVDADAIGTLTNNVTVKGQTANNDQPEDTASASVTVKTEPGLTGIIKTLESVSVNGAVVETANGLTVNKNDSITLTYKITVTGAKGAKYHVTDEDATLVAGSWSGTLGESGAAVITVTKTVTATEAGKLTVTNKAYVKPGDDNTKPIPDDPSNPKDPNKGHPSNEVKTEITVNDSTPSTPELTITKTVDKTEAVVGDTITYTITVKNNGNATATNVFIKDVLDSKLEWKSAGYSWTAPHVPSDTDDSDMVYGDDAGTKGYSEQPAEGKYAITHEMRPGAELTLTITTTAKTAGTVTNSATVDSNETNPKDDTSEDVTVTTPTIDDGKGISIEKTRVTINGDQNATTAKTGDVIVWNIKVTNHSNVEKTVTLNEELSGATLSERSVTLASSASETVTATYVVKSTDSGTLFNTVIGGTDNPDERTEGTDDGTEIQNPNLQISKEVSSNRVKVGDSVTYTIKVSNTGNADATNVVVTDPLAGSLLRWQSARATSGTGNVAGEWSTEPTDGKYEIGTVAPGQVITLVINAETIAEGTIRNIASVDSDETDPTPSGEVTTESEKYKLYSITKDRLTEIPGGVTIPAGVAVNTDDPVEVGANGATLLYRITVTGDKGASYRVSDEGATYVGGAGMEGTIPESGKVEIYVIRTFSRQDIVNGKLINTAILTNRDSNTDDPNPDPEREGIEDSEETDVENPDPGIEPTPTPGPGVEPTPGPGVEPTPGPGVEPTPGPGVEPTPGPGVEPTPGPEVEPTPGPGVEPTPDPGVEPTPGPGVEPTPGPGVEPTPGPGGEPTPTPGPGVEPTPGPGVEPTPGPGGEPTPTPGPGDEPTPGPGDNPAPGPGDDPAPGPGDNPAPGPEEPTTATVVQIPAGGGLATPAVTPVITPVEPTTVTPEEPEAEPEDGLEELDENENPLAAPEGSEEEDAVIPVADVEFEDDETPLAGGKGSHWALVNFALMNLAVFESLMLLIGYFVNTKKEKDEEDEEKKLKKSKHVVA